jgi:hypothetical protein
MHDARREFRYPIVDLRFVRRACAIGGDGGGVDGDGGAMLSDRSYATVATAAPHFSRPEEAMRAGLLNVEDLREFVVRIKASRRLYARVLCVKDGRVQPRRNGYWILPVKNLAHHGGARPVHLRRKRRKEQRAKLC